MAESQRIHLVVAAALVAVAGMLLLLIMLTGPIQAVRAAPDTLCVAPGGMGCVEPCGGCYPSIQAAVSAANPHDAILVAEGVYTTNGAAQVAYVNESITIRGGYTTTNWVTSYPVTQPATLDAEGQGRVVFISGDVTPTLEGLWLTNGLVDGDGGGIYALNAHPVVSGCYVFSNTASLYGGGIYLGGGGDAMLRNNRIFSNTAAKGGGVLLSVSENVTLTNNQAFGNVATAGSGGGVYLGGSRNATLTGNDIYSNTARYNGGGVLLVNSHDAMLVSNDIYSNTSGSYGGGLFFETSTDAMMIGNTIYRNTATAFGGGGMGFISSDTPRMIGNIVMENRIGGGNGAGVWIEATDANLLHTTLARNSGGSGHGLFVSSYATVALTNTILVSHTVGVQASGSGSAVVLEATLWGAGEWANGVDVYAMVGTITTGTVNVWGDPGFVAPDSGDYHIGPGSAAVDRGVDAGVTDDIDGDSRPIGRPDLGADEWGTWLCLPLVLRDYQ